MDTNRNFQPIGTRLLIGYLLTSLGLLMWSLWSVPINGFALLWAGIIGIINGALGSISYTIKKNIYNTIGLVIVATIGQTYPILIFLSNYNKNITYWIQYISIVFFIRSGVELIQKKIMEIKRGTD